MPRSILLLKSGSLHNIVNCRMVLCLPKPGVTRDRVSMSLSGLILIVFLHCLCTRFFIISSLLSDATQYFAFKDWFVAQYR